MSRFFIGIDGGGTKTTGRLLSIPEDDDIFSYQDMLSRSEVLCQVNAGPCALSNDFDLACLNIAKIIDELMQRSGINSSRFFLVAGLSGAENRELHARMQRFLSDKFSISDKKILLTSDAHTSAVGAGGGEEVICIALGTGSVACVLNEHLQYQIVGGWGFPIADDGGAAALGRLAVREALWETDERVTGDFLQSKLTSEVKKVIGTDRQQILTWLSNAGAYDYGQLAPVITALLDSCGIAKKIFQQHTKEVEKLINTCYSGNPLRIILTGGLAEVTKPFLSESILSLLDNAQGGSVDGACYLAIRHFDVWRHSDVEIDTELQATPSLKEQQLLCQLDNLLSESRNLNSMNIDVLPTSQVLDIINQEDSKVPLAVKSAIPDISKAVDLIVQAFKQGGRLIYLGAGTSGRLGILDAVECPPTFSVDHDMVLALIAGGEKAVYKAVEGAEDSLDLAVDDLKGVSLTSSDVVVGIAASGRTPYVIGGLRFAKTLGANTVAVSCNPDSLLADAAEVGICAPVGPEVLTGSTRMKSGTAQKLILNMLTTASMIQIGKCYQNLMVDVNASNEKLVARASRIVMQATGCTHEEAKTHLAQAQYRAKLAILMIQSRVSASVGEQALGKYEGSLRNALNSLTKHKEA